MANRLNYALPIAQQLAGSTARRLLPGGLAARLADPPDEQQAFVIVSGPGRSGTSAVARVLHESGVVMGTAFDPASDQNRVGFYEDTAVRTINERMIGELGLSDIDRSQRWPWRSAVVAVAERFASEMEEVAARAEGGWKDPLFSVTLEAWLPYLPHRPKLVLCLRSPEAYVHSVTRIYGLVSRENVEAWWVQELERLLALMRDYRLPTTCVEYDRLVRNPEAVVAEIASFIGRPLDPQYVEPNLRHFAHAVPKRHRELYERVRALGPMHDDPKADGITIDEYISRVRAAESRVADAKEQWADQAGAPGFRLEGSDAIEAAREATTAYVAVLSEAQAEMGALEPPDRLDDYHQLVRMAVDRERLTAQMMLQATDGPKGAHRSLNDVLAAWAFGSSPDVVAHARREREAAYARAIADTDDQTNG